MPGDIIQKGGGVYKVGIPYQINGQWFVPREEPAYDRLGIASWYGADFHGRKTANGEVYDMDALTAAHPTLPMPSYAYVTNMQNGRTVLVRINDRGPYAHNRIIDLSRRTAFLLGIAERGTSQVRVRYAGPAPLDGNDRREWRFLAAQSWYRQAVAQMRSRSATPWRSVVMRPSNAVVSMPLPPAPKAIVPAGAAHYVEIGTFQSRDLAIEQQRALSLAGPAEIIPMPLGARLGWRLRLGPFPDWPSAITALRATIAVGALGARLTLE
jgi:rare lipoprotein A